MNPRTRSQLYAQHNPRAIQTHERLTKSAFDFTSDFAHQCAQARLRGEPMPSSANASGGASGASSSANHTASSSASRTPSGRRPCRGGRSGGRGGRLGRSGLGGRGGQGRGGGRDEARGRGRGRSRAGRGRATLPPLPIEPAPAMEPDVEGLLGTNVRRSFDGEWYDGQVSFRTPYYRVTSPS